MGASKDGDEDLLLALFTLVLSVLLVLVCIAAGWYVMWKLFLSRYVQLCNHFLLKIDILSKVVHISLSISDSNLSLSCSRVTKK